MRNRTTIATLIAGLTLGVAAHAAEPANPPTVVNAPAYFNGVTVAIDPATGRLRAPTPAEQAALQLKASKTARSPSVSGMPRNQAEANKTIRRLPDGSVMAMVPEDLMSQVVAVQKADGSIQIQHVGADGKIVDDHSAGEIK